MSELDNVLVAKDANGNKVVVIPQVIFKGKRTIIQRLVDGFFLTAGIGVAIEVEWKSEAVKILVSLESKSF